MKNLFKVFGIIALTAIIGFLSSCGSGDGGTTAVTGSTTVSVNGVMLDKNSITLTVGGTANLTETVTPANATNKAVMWTTTNEEVATVTTDGVINAVAAGSATITVTTVDGSKTAKCYVDVIPETPPGIFAIIMQNDDNGTATANPNTAEPGDEITITATPNSGYRFDEWQVVSGDVTLSNSSANPENFTMPENVVIIKAIFAFIPIDTPSLSITPPTFDDLTTGYGSQGSKAVTITNNGTGTANITSIELDSVGNTAFNISLWGINLPKTLPVSETLTWNVNVKTGLAEGTYTGNIIVTYDSEMTAVAVVSVTVKLGTYGSVGNPFLVYTVEDLSHVGKPTTNGDYDDWTLSKYYKQMDDIDLSSIDNWTPIGRYSSSSTPFTGSYDGNGKTISNLSNSGNYVGLFGYINGVVKNVCLLDCDIKGYEEVGGGLYEEVGGLVGRNSGTVENCYTTGNVSGTRDFVGGVVGYNLGTVRYCYSTCNVSGKAYVGGVVGRGSASYCYSTGNVSGTTYVGGVSCGGSSIQYCYSTGNVSGTKYVGGVVAYNERGNRIQYCYSTGNVSGTEDFVGGVVGYNFKNNNPSSAVIHCYSTSDVTGTRYVGGVVGINEDNLYYCYATGNVSGTTYVGGIVGYNDDGKVQLCVALNPNVKGTSSIRRVVGFNNGGTMPGNEGRNDMKRNNSTYSWTSNVNGEDGLTTTSAKWNVKSYWTNGSFSEDYWNFSGISETNLPTLRIPGSTQNPVIKPLP
jgi:hypothetical protein